MNRKLYDRLEIIGVFFTFFCGLFLRYSYNITKGSTWTLLFGSVNSSIWEQTKVFAVPFIAWSILTFAFTRPYFKSFFTAKIISLYIIICTQILSYCLLKGVIGERITVLEYSFSLLSVCLGYLFSYSFGKKITLKSWFWVAIFGFGLFMSAYICFTAAPFKIELFYDEVTKSYGIPLNFYIADYVLDSIYFG